MDAEQAPRNRPGRCRLTLTINGQHDVVRPIASQADDVTRAFRLSRTCDVFDVARTVHGPTCTSGDGASRRGDAALGTLHRTFSQPA